ncbi:MAG: MATE family efflux transporter [Lentisphaeria bacterium]|nr:MATE family efflux transporter [Lentisphaeria bacterium]
MARKYQVDMTTGPLLGKIIKFAIPLMMANAMSLMFNAADLIVLGRFAPDSMAAVGAAPSFTTLMLNLFWGIASAVNVLAARYTGAKDRINVFRTVHTSITVSIIGGFTMGLLGVLLTKPMMQWMKVPAEIFDDACLYVWIWCLGIPFMIIFSFGSAILRAIGDTRRPLIYMVVAGIINVILNIFFVVICKMDVAGVAIATKFANFLTAVLVLIALTKTREQYRLRWKKLHIKWNILKEMLRIGVPAGAQGMLYSVSNILIQSTLNSFGADAIAGSTAALSLESIVHVAFGAFGLAVVSFVGQNHGADKPRRVIRSIWLCLGCGFVTAVVLGGLELIFKRQLLGIYNSNLKVIEWGVLRMNYQLTFYFMLAFLEILAGALRGLGHSFVPTVISLMGTCVFRVIWIFFIFPKNPCMENLMISYPISWIMICLGNGTLLFCICRKMVKEHDRLAALPASPLLLKKS